MNSTSYSVLDVIKKSADYLKKKEIENARLNAELLIGCALNLNRVQLYLNFERIVKPAELDKLKALLIRRASREPIQYLIGETEFYSLKFKVNQSTLIPRPETEILVEAALKIGESKFAQKEKIDVLDIGTGSGNIAIALAINNPKIQVTALDRELDALEIARQNAENHGVAERITFWRKDVFEIFPDEFSQLDMIVSNPPYISKTEMEKLPQEIINFEPRVALAGGEDGLKFFYRISELIYLVKENGVVMVEIGATQAEQVRDIFLQKKMFSRIQIFKDLNKLDRVIVAEC